MYLLIQEASRPPIHNHPINLQHVFSALFPSWDLYMHAQSLQSCPTLCDPMDCSPPGSSVPGDSPGKNTGVGCCALLQGIFLTQGSNLYLLPLLH